MPDPVEYKASPAAMRAAGATAPARYAMAPHPPNPPATVGTSSTEKP